MPDDRWDAVAHAVRTRRAVLGLTQQQAAERSGGAVSLPTWSLIENARQDRYKPRTLVGVARALDWPHDAIERILAGDDPADLGEAGQSAPHRADLAALNGKLEQLGPDELAAVEAIVDRLIDRRR